MVRNSTIDRVEAGAVQYVKPLLIQIRNAYYSVDCGMSYVIRTGDGRFVLIDGGVGELEEADHLYDVLSDKNVLPGKPVIAAWFITHPHCDHFGTFVKFMNRYEDQVDLERVLFHFADPAVSPPGTGLNDRTAFYAVLDRIRPKTEVITPHTGERYVFSDAEFRILFVCEDLYPEKIPNVNDTSIVIRMELAGRSVLFLGDLMRQGADRLCRQCPKEDLATEFLQVGHHGYNGGSDELYRIADPSVLLWPCPNFWFPVVRLWETNDYLIRSEKVLETIVSGRQETVIDLTKPVEPFRPYELSESGPVYRETFFGKRIMDLHWSCITGGETGYRPALITPGPGECVLETSEKDAYSVVEIIQAGVLKSCGSFVLTLRGSVREGSEKVGFFIDYSSPTVFSEEHAFWLDTALRGPLELRIEADAGNRKMRIFIRNELVRESDFKEAGDFCLILKNAALSLREICVWRMTLSS
ncbi:MAG: MBL fold metallo-hydrolase [Lachnospiraceae bacterium]|nr:MBL fold metallo-hydrolase [Lachnospiraceae bacterium]